MGRVQSVPLLLELMADKQLGVSATAAYKRITGANGVEGEKPFPPPPVAEGEDEEEALPPDPAKAKADWEQRQSGMPSDRAWQAGVGIADGMLPIGFDDASPRDAARRLSTAAGAARRDARTLSSRRWQFASGSLTMAHPEIDNRTPFAFAPLFIADEDGRPIVATIVKATFDVSLRGECDVRARSRRRSTSKANRTVSREEQPAPRAGDGVHQGGH